MEYTLQNTLLAKEFLIKDGFKESDFTSANIYDVECGYILGEPLLISGDDCVSAFNLWNDKIFWQQHEDEYIDYMMNNL